MNSILNYIAIGVVGTTIWVCFEIWRAPLLEEQKDGSWKTIKPAKKLFKSKKK